MSDGRPTFDTKDRQRIYDYVAERGPVDSEELFDRDIVAVTPHRARQIVAVLRRDGYLTERMGQLRVSPETEDRTEYAVEDVDFVVRRARQEDLSGLVGVIRQITQEETYIVGESVGHELDAIVEYVDAIVRDDVESRSMFFVAIVDGEVIGWVDLREPERTKLRESTQLTMGILDEYRGRGIGARLLEHAHDWADANDYRKVFSSLPETNDEAVAFLKRNGWVTEAVRPDHYLVDGEPVDEVMRAHAG